MRVADLQSILRAADPGAVLVPPRVLEQIIQEAGNLRGSLGFPPHLECYVARRQTLFRHIEQTYLDLEPDQLLPDVVILLVRPPSEELSDVESKQVLLKYWRLLFHASVHLAVENSLKRGSEDLLPNSVDRLIETIGRDQFDEIREILVDDRCLMKDPTDGEVFIEFAAVYLETRYFAVTLLPALFPGLHDLAAIEGLLAEDVNAESLFSRTRLENAPDPFVAITGSEESESLEQYWNLVRSAERANLQNDNVLAAILRTRASRIAPAELGQQTRDEALADIERLLERFALALRLSPAEAEGWGKYLRLLLDKADQGYRPAEARLLYDLQRVCSDSERHVYALDPIEWFLSATKRPMRRPVPCLRQVSMMRSLRGTKRFLAVVRLHELDRKNFSELINGAVSTAEAAIRDQFGRVLAAALQDVGLTPTNQPERVALSKMVAEWLDRILSHGFITFSDLRDTISRNQLKMPDLGNPSDLIRGDALLRLDRRLASMLDGVYRPSDLYMRAIERLTAVNFGTSWGRLLTVWVTVPFGAAALLLQAMGVLLHLICDPQRHPIVNWMYHVFVGPSRQEGAPGETAQLVWHFILLTLIGSFLMALIHAREFRARCETVLHAAGQKIHKSLVEIPLSIIRMASLQKLLRSWQMHVVFYLLKSLAVTTIIWFMLPGFARVGWALPVLFVATTMAVNSRLGEATFTVLAQGIRSFLKMLRAGLLGAVYRLVMRIFKQIRDGVDLVLFTVDDWLRFGSDGSRRSITARAVIGVLWFPVSYLCRFIIVVMIEPGFNPAKAPVSYVAAKVMIPFAPRLTSYTALILQPIFGHWLAYTIAVPMIWLSPDIFGFLFWETKENWSLYRANRRKNVSAVAIEPRGDTVKALLLPGFHSGAVPRLYGRLRAAERHAIWTSNWAEARKTREELEEIRQCVERFVCRELVALLERSPGWQGHRLSVAKVELTVTHIGIKLAHSDYAERYVNIHFQLRRATLVASIENSGWLDQLTPEQLNSFAATLASVYKQSDVDLVSEQIRANLPTAEATWDVTDDGMIIRLEPNAEPFSIRFADLDQSAASNDGHVPTHPSIDPHRLVFKEYKLNWAQWTKNWEMGGNGQTDSDANMWYRQLVRLSKSPQPAVGTLAAPADAPVNGEATGAHTVGELLSGREFQLRPSPSVAQQG